ncbi:MAG: C25 family cysteine peptidase [Caldilineaceae bacterium]
MNSPHSVTGHRIRLPSLIAALIAIVSLVLTPAPAMYAAVQEQASPTQITERSAELQAISVDIEQSDNHIFAATIQFPPPRQLQVKGGDNKPYIQLFTEGIDVYSGQPGKPDVPVYRRLLGVPHGAQVQVSAVQSHVRKSFSGLLYPVQPSPLDEEKPDPDFSDRPFTKDAQAYNSDQPFPAQVVQVTKVGRVRDLDVVQINVAAGQFKASQQIIELFDKVSFQIRFEGGSGYFLPSAARSLFEPPDKYDFVINHIEIDKDNYIDPNGPILTCIGYEYLIITDPSFRSAADSLAAWKQAKGITTHVIETGSDPGDAGTTTTDIQAYIRNQFNNCLIRPSYVLLFGDAEHISPFYRSVSFTTTLASTDLDYSLMDNLDIMPDLALGRISVDTLTDAQKIADKIVNYEQTPPHNPDFYNNVSIASYFECCRPEVAADGTDDRSFIETSEMVRDFLLTKGYDVERIYTTDTGHHSNPSKTDYYNSGSRSTVPTYYYDGSQLPVDLRASSGFAWNGSTTDVIDAFNEGRFLILHRDHGSKNGWGDPGFSVSNIGSLTNTELLPVVYSINCSSGRFDNETDGNSSTSDSDVYWAEKLLRADGGAVGIIGDTFNSPTWANSALTRGLFDATWPKFVPSFGKGTGSKVRLGDILNYGKEYLVSQVGVAQTAGSVTANDADDDVILYHVFGDPTLEMWKDNPYPTILPGGLDWTPIATDTIHIRYPISGTLITIQQGGQPIGRGLIANGEATVKTFGNVTPGQPLLVTASHPGVRSRRLHPAKVSGTIQPGQGGNLSDSESRFGIHFPAGATQKQIKLYYATQISPTLPVSSTLAVLRSFTLDANDEDGNEVSHFDQDYQMNLSYNDSDLQQAGLNESSLQCLYLDESDHSWRAVSTTIDGTSNTITCQADHLTEFALVANKSSEGNAQKSLFLPLVVR